MTELEKDTNIKIRIDRETKDKFSELCKQKAINSSALIRQLIKQWIIEQTTDTTPSRRKTDIK